MRPSPGPLPTFRTLPIRAIFGRIFGRILGRIVLASTAILGFGSRPAISGDAPSIEAPLSTIERHAVRLHFTFQRDLDAESKGGEPADSTSWTEQLRRWRMTWRITGFVVKDRRTVVSSDHFSSPGTIRSIEIRTARGARVPVTGWEFLPNTRLCVFHTATDLDTEPIPFTSPDPTQTGPLVVGNVTEGMTGLESWAEPLTTARRRIGDTSRPHGFDFAARADAGLLGANLTNRVDLVMRPDGSPLGFRIGTPFDLDRSSWAGTAIVADIEKSVPIAGLAERARTLHDESFVHEIRLTYRRDESADDEGFAASGFSTDDSKASPSEDARLYGYAIAPNLLLVPQPIPDAFVRRIAKVTVEDEGDPIIEAAYEGRWAGTGAFVVRLLSATLDAAPHDGPFAPPPALGRAFLVHRVSKRAGSRRDSVTYDRSVGMQPGYADRPFFTSEQPVLKGSFLMDLDGRVFGVATEFRPEDADHSTRSANRGVDEAFGTVAALFSEGPFAESSASRASGPKDWLKSLDRRAVPQKSEEAKRRPWLGVEVVPVIGADVAEALELSGPTRDGTRGLLVNVVYADSPASKIGLRPDDVLLTARRTSGPGADAPPVDLKESSDEWSLERSFSGGDGSAPAPWVARRNTIVKLLESFGVGTTYDLELWRDGAVKSVSLTVEQSPRDVDSAIRSSDDAVGLTVKELTYEVRHALHLASTDPGVLVWTVEDGRAAFQARIGVNELIREMDGAPVADPAAFEKGLADARAAGRASVRVVVRRLDRSRFVDLRLSGTTLPPTLPAATSPK